MPLLQRSLTSGFGRARFGIPSERDLPVIFVESLFSRNPVDGPKVGENQTKLSHALGVDFRVKPVGRLDFLGVWMVCVQSDDSVEARFAPKLRHRSASRVRIRISDTKTDQSAETCSSPMFCQT